MVLTTEIIIGAVIIFLLRVVDMAMDTLRVLFVVRGKKWVVWILGFFQSAIFILAVSNVLKGENHPITIVAYAAGFATGNLIGMIIEDRLAVGFKRVSIITQTDGEEIASEIRKFGYGVTVTKGMGKDGAVAMLFTNVKRKHVREVELIASKVDDNAFITADEFSPLNHGGFWRK